ncbi:MAG: hypothetical protein KDB96_10435 [Flavobacteriales bacterium]|nr:hypothetical protein [Flavobacteriales bacterium]MCB0817908.1 hypothetical protein [Flavobacteriales bacterium]
MRTPHTHLMLGLAAVLLMAGCSGSKSYSKKADKLDEAGMYSEAADFYYQALVRNNKNIDATIGLKKTGQQVLDDKLSNFFKAFSMGGQKREAVDAYLDGKSYLERARRVGVQLEIPDHYKRDFEEVKGEFLVELYERGQSLLEKQDFKGAEATFAEIAKLEPDYKDANSLQALAYLEPLYRQGKADLEGGHYRKAYDELDKVVAKDAGYKDARELRDQAVTLGRYSIGVLPFTSSVRQKEMAARVQAYATTALTELDDPFIKVVDRENIDRILEEQRLGLSGVVDEATAVQVGNLMGAQAVLMGNVIDYREEPGQLQRSTKTGFESYRVRQLNSETGKYYYETKYKPVKYAEYYRQDRVSVSFSYKLVSLETGEVLLSRIVEDSSTDHIYYADYQGNRENLFPERNGLVNTARNARSELAGLLSASREMKPISVISNDLLRKTSNTVAEAVRQDLASKLP